MGESLVDIVHQNDTTVTVPGGSPLNMAIGLARLGIQTRLATAFGSDAHGNLIAETLQAAGISVIRAEAEVTSVARADIRGDGSAQYDFTIANDLPEVGPDVTVELLHAGSLGAFIEPGSAAIARAFDVASPDTLISFDPNIRPSILDDLPEARATAEALFARAHVVKLSDEDAAWLFPGLDHEQVFDRLLRHRVRLVAITRGSAGSDLATAGARAHIAAPPVTVADTVGAGDSFMAGMLRFLLTRPMNLGDEGWIRAAGTAGARNAAYTVGKSGASMPTLQQLDLAHSF